MVMILAYGSLKTEWRKSGENEKPGGTGRKREKVQKFKGNSD
jgi:hypothetical protein